MRLGVLLLLAAVWLALSGPYTLHGWLILAFGVLSVAFVWRLYLALERAAGGGHEFFRASAWLRLPRFLPVFVLRVALANLHVTRLILSPNPLPHWLRAPLLRTAQSHPRLMHLVFLVNARIQPRLRRVRASQKTTFGQVLYANYITLTPGTITLDLRDGRLLVYALDAASESDLMDGTMDRDVLRLEGGSS